MFVILICETNSTERALIAKVLTGANHQTLLPSDEKSIESLLGKAEMVIADIDLALLYGWLGDEPASLKPAQLIISSTTTELIAPWSSQVRGAFLKPARSEAILNAVYKVGQPIATQPMLETNWAIRDGQLEQAGFMLHQIQASFSDIAKLVAEGIQVKTGSGHFGDKGASVFLGRFWLSQAIPNGG